MALLHAGGLIVLVLLVPLAVVEWRRIRRERRAARAVGLEPQRLWRTLQRSVCAGLVITLAAIAASEPSLRQTSSVELRANAEVYLFVDASASMLAGASSHAPTRLEQARQAAADFAQSLPSDLPLGAGAFPQSPLPLTAPIGDRQLFLTALDHLTAPGTLPEHLYGGVTATNFANLSTLTTAHFFLPKTRRRIVVLLTDAEGPSFDVASTAASLKRLHIHLVFVRLGSPHDRIWIQRKGERPVADPKYQANLADIGEVRLLARDTGGAFYSQGQIRNAIDEVNRLSGHGPDRPAQTLSLYSDSLGQYFLLAALPCLAWLASGLLPFSAPLRARARLRRRRSARRHGSRTSPLLQSQEGEHGKMRPA